MNLTILQNIPEIGCTCVSSQYQATFSPPMQPGNEATSNCDSDTGHTHCCGGSGSLVAHV